MLATDRWLMGAGVLALACRSTTTDPAKLEQVKALLTDAKKNAARL